MDFKRKKRLYLLVILLIAVIIASALVLYALKQNINLYLTPEQIATEHMAANRTFRLGGVVETGSVMHQPNSTKVSFVLTDFKDKVVVKYNGILPTLFREGQGIITTGKLNAKGIFIANQVLAKHDEKYMPPGIAKKTPATTHILIANQI